MPRLHLQELLAPTWRERVRADYYLDKALSSIRENSQEQGALLPWPESIMAEVRELKPSPAEFLSALVPFWAEVALLEHRRWASESKAIDSDLTARLASPDAARFPMTPDVPPPMAIPVNCRGAWDLVSRLGPYVALIEKQLLACMEHPIYAVHNAGACAFGTMDAISDEVYRACLAYADREGYSGGTWTAGAVLSKHTRGTRVALLLERFAPDAPRSAFGARLGVIRLLEGNDAETARGHLQAQLGGTWTVERLVDLIHTLRVLSEKAGFDTETVAKVKALAQHGHYRVRSAVAQFLARHSPQTHHDLLRQILMQMQMKAQMPDEKAAWMLMGICMGLAKHTHVPPDLLCLAVRLGLGNYSACDGAPHCYAAALAGSSPANAQAALPVVASWWQAASVVEYLDIDFDNIEEALDTAEALGDAAAPLKPWLERALAYWCADKEQEPEEAGTASDDMEKYMSSRSSRSYREKLAQREAEMRDYFPEVYAEWESGPNAAIDEHVEEEYEDPLEARLRAAIARLCTSHA